MKTQLLLLLLGIFSHLTSAQIGISQPQNITLCSEFGFNQFNLSAQNAAILGALNPNSYTLTYHTTQAGAIAGTNAIANPAAFSNTSNPQVVYVRVQENANPSNFEVASFSLILNLSPSIYDQDFSACDLDASPSDGATTFDLEEIAEQVYWFSSIEPNDLEVTFFSSQADAQNNVNGLMSPFTSTSQNQVIYARGSYYATGCFKVIAVTLVANDCTGMCLPPDGLTVNNITGTSATISWTPLGDEFQWEILVLYAGGPFPLPTMEGTATSSNPITVTGLECPEAFDVYVRAVCSSNISDWSERVTFETQGCDGSGQPLNLTACAENGTACFDLTVNENVVLGNLPSEDYAITYYNTAENAASGVNAISTVNSYCTTIAMGSTPIYMRVENIDSGEFQVLAFNVTAQEIVIDATPLESLIQCDDDGNGFVVFDLTVLGAQIGTGNPLAYYSSNSDALAATNPIQNPNVFAADIATPLTSIFVRETVAGSCDIVHSAQINALANCNFANVCAGANSLCNALGVPFANTVGIESAEEGNDYGCLGDIPNPTWFYLPVSSAGTINLMIEQGTDVNITDADLDVDFICYGPYINPVAPCSGMLTENKIVSCSYSANAVEYPTIPNAQPGQFYIIMTTNYSNQPGYIRITETGSSQGEIDCTGFRLNAFLDANINGVKDSGEVYFTLGQFHYEKNNDSEIHNVTSPNGIYRIYDLSAENSYDLSYSINPLYLPYFAVTTAAYGDVSVVAGAGLQDYNFPITIVQAYNDLTVTIVPEQAPRPGFTYTNKIIYTNLGSQSTSGTVTFVKDPLVSITSNSQAGIVSDTSGFTYNFTNLLPFESRSMMVTMQVPTIPAVALGDLLINSANITLAASDVASENNSSTSAQEIIGSFDPNDKMESRGERILITDFANVDYLHYTIRFENTGTASAINVRINDVLDSRLDENSIMMVDASHDYVLDRVENRLNWRFENILLPPTIQDPIGSHGFVHFKIKPDPGYAVGDIISNTASIFFDFNPAIVTNTFTSEFVSTLATADFSHSAFAIYPNPAGDFVTVSIPDGSENITAITISDMLGKNILSTKANAASQVIDVSNINTGIYLLEVTTGTTKTVKKLVIE